MLQVPDQDGQEDEERQQPIGVLPGFDQFLAPARNLQQVGEPTQIEQDHRVLVKGPKSRRQPRQQNLARSSRSQIRIRAYDAAT